MRHISSKGLALIKQFEGFRSHPYRDAVGVWTIGYGETRGVGPSTPAWSEAYASQRLAQRVRSDFEPYIHRLGVPLNQNQFDALCSFVYNLGPGYLAPGHSMGDALRARNFKAAADAFMLYDRAGGRVLEGLRRRREEERALFLRRAKAPSRTERLIAAWQKKLAQLRLVAHRRGYWLKSERQVAGELKADIRRHGGKA